MTVFCKKCDQIVVAVFGVDMDYALWVCPGCAFEAARSANRQSAGTQNSAVGQSGQHAVSGSSAR